MNTNIDHLFTLPSPVEPLDLSSFGIKKHEIWIKRDDLIHDVISGNKWRKLKYNIQHYFNNQFKGIVSFGGAYSNHIAALGEISKKLDIPTIIFIRGEKPRLLSPTLKKCREDGIDLRFVSRKQYRENKTILSDIDKEFPDYLVIPEGASNDNGIKGCCELVKEIHIGFDEIYCDVGTGATCVGISSALNNNQHAIGIVVLKGAKNINNEMGDLLKLKTNSFTLKHDYHFGGYAKKNNDLIKFMKTFYDKTGIKTDPIYSGKMFYGLIRELQKDNSKKSKRIIALHSGGLQGISGYEKRYGLKIF
jgi:1-aminocyclopropane-1-carboxylate deaminase